jgi:hypothetical protein
MLCVVLLALGTVAAPAAAQEMTARARVDSTRFLVGDWITVTVDLRHPVGTAVDAAVPDTLGRFIVIERRPPEARAAGSTAAVVVAAYDSGTFTLPPLEFLARVPGDTAARRLVTGPLTLEISTVLVDTGADIRDIVPPLGIPPGLAEVLLMLAALLLVAAAVVAVVRYRKRKPAAPVAAAPVPERPAHVIALEELARLKEQRLWQQGLVKAYYSELTGVLRRYFENRYAIQALEQTTGEIMASLDRHPSSAPARAEIEGLLRMADLVKFARLEPGTADHEEGLRTAYEVVERTRPAERPLQERTGSHVGS